MSQSRQPKGIPVGGQFAQNAHDEAGSLAPTSEFDQIDWAPAEDFDDPETLSTAHQAWMAVAEDHILSRPHMVSLGDGRVAAFWHESSGENTLDQRPDREARAIIDSKGVTTSFQTSIGGAPWEDDHEFAERLNSATAPNISIPEAPTVTIDSEGREVHTGSRFKDGSSARDISRALRGDISEAVQNGTLPREFDYEVRGTDASGFGIVGVKIDISGWEHGGNYGLIPGQSIYDQSPIRAAKVERAERVLQRLLEDRDQKTVLSDTDTQHAYVWNVIL